MNDRAWRMWLAAVVCAGAVGAQCDLDWQSVGVPGVDGPVRASCRWDPDGPGPAPSVVVLGGSFAIAGSVLANNLVTWDPATGALQPIGAGVDGDVLALAVSSTGDLWVGGLFTTAGVVAVSNLARFDGVGWDDVAGGTDLDVRSIAAAPNGDMLVGGYFTSAGGVPAQRVARYDGSQWSALGGGCSGLVSSLLIEPNGDLVAGGQFATAGGITVNNVARWNGNAWSALGQGMPGSFGTNVNALARDANGDLVAGGFFFNAGSSIGVRNVARWDGSNWLPMGGGFNSVVSSLRLAPSGELFASGWFQYSNGVAVNGIARWTGSSWVGLGGSSPGNVVRVEPLPGGELLACGGFTIAGSQGVKNVARWDGAAWQAIAPGFNGSIRALMTMSNGEVVAAGDFVATSTLGSGPAFSSMVARLTAQGWQPLGGGVGGGSLFGLPAVHALAEMPNGDLIVAGVFSQAGTGPAANIARWDGAAWSALGSGIIGRVYALQVLPSGDLVVGGRFLDAGGSAVASLARWDGTNWSSLGGGVQGLLGTGQVNALALTPSGELLVAGNFVSAGGSPVSGLARWNGTAWSGFGSGLSIGVFGAEGSALRVMTNGDIVVSGGFQMAGGQAANRIARWDGASWQAMGAGLDAVATVLHELPNGDLLIGGPFVAAGGGAAAHLARWDGVQFAAVAPEPNAAVYAIEPIGAGLLIGGDMTVAGGGVAAYLSLVTSQCPATAMPLGSACPSVGGGTNTLTATQLPWVGSTFEATASGLPSPSIAVAVTGLSTTAVPLSLLPQGQSGCSLLVSPDWLSLELSNTGTAVSTVMLPNNAALVGQTLFHQVLPLALDAMGNLVSITSTNGLTLTIGAL